MNLLKYCGLISMVILGVSPLGAEPSVEAKANDKHAKVLISPGARYAETRFVVSNETEAPWIIEGVTSDCSCASIDFPRTPNKPGAEITLRATVVLGPEYGTLKKTFLVSFSDGSASARLVLEIERPKWINADTDSIIWSDSEREIEKHYKLTLDERLPSGWSVFFEPPRGYDLSSKRIDEKTMLIGLTPRSTDEPKGTEMVYGVTKEGVVEEVGRVILRPFKR